MTASAAPAAVPIVRARLARAGMITLAVITAALGAAWMVIATDAGRLAVARRLIDATVLPPGLSMTIASTGGDWPSHIILNDVVLSDRQGPWLTVGRIDLRWRPTALIAGAIDADLVAATAARFVRLPVSSEPSASAPTAPVRLLEDLRTTTIRRLEIADAVLDPGVVDGGATINASGTLEGPRQSLSLTVRRTDAPGELSLTARRRGNDVETNLQAAAFGVQLTAGALASPNGALAGQLRLACGSDRACLSWTGGRITSGRAEGTLGGTLDRPRVDLTVETKDVMHDTRRLAGVTAKASLIWNADGAVAIAADGTVEDMRETFPEVRALLQDAATWSAAVTWAGGGLRVEALRLASGELTAEARGQWPFQDGPSGEVTVAARGVGRLAGLADSASRSVLRLTLTDARNAHVSLNAEHLPQPLAQHALQVDGDVRLDAERASLNALRASWGPWTASGSSAWTRAPGFDHDRTELTYGGRLADRSPVPEEIAGTATLTGPLSTLAVALAAHTPTLMLTGHDAAHAVAGKVALARSGAVWTGKFEAAATHESGDMVLGGRLQIDRSRVAAPDVMFAGLQSELRGNVTVVRETMRVDGRLSGRVHALGALGRLVGAPASGQAEININAGTRDNRQTVAVHVDGRDLSLSALTAGKLVMDASLADLDDTDKLSLSIASSDARIAGRELSMLAVSAQGSLSQLSITAEAKGTPAHPVTFVAAARADVAQTLDVTVDRLIVQDGAFDARLKGTARVQASAEAVDVAPMVVEIEGGTIESALRIDRQRDTVDGYVKASGLVPDAGLSAPSAVDGIVRLSGSASNAAVRATLSARYAPARTGLAQDLVFTADAVVDSGIAAITGAASGLPGEAPAFTARIPMRVDLTGARLSLDADAPISAHARWTGEVAPLWQILALDQHTLRGDADIDLTAAGTLDQPLINGRLRIARGAYENFVSGTVLRDLELNISAADGAPIGVALAAQDTQDGSLNLSGTITRAADIGAWTTNLKAGLNRLHVLRRDDVIAAASGELAYDGGLVSGTLRGKLDIVRSTLRLGGTYTPEVPLLRSREEAVGLSKGTQSAGFSGVALDIALSVADILRIEGNGLESFWRGELRARGTIAAPDLSGTLTLARGTFSFLGQSFQLDRGTITFTGGGAIAPELLMTASRQVEDVTATVTIKGAAAAPSVTLSSQPALPRDEILARILFRKGVGALGPIESLQLASTATSLTGLSRGGITGFLRRTIGVDTLSFGGASGNAVAIGRQIGGSLYVGFEQDLTDSGRQIIVEWRLTPSLSLRSSTNGQAGADLGVVWRKNY